MSTGNGKNYREAARRLPGFLERLEKKLQEENVDAEDLVEKLRKIKEVLE